MVLARIRIKAGCVDDYIAMSKATDDLVQQHESGTAHHVFVSDPQDPLSFTWAEAFVNDEAFLEHLNAPHIAKYFKEHERLGKFNTESGQVFRKMSEISVALVVLTE